MTASGLQNALGGLLPELKEGAFGELVVAATDLKDPSVAAEFNREKETPFLDADTLLWMSVRPSGVPASLKEAVITPGFHLPHGSGCSVAVVVEQPLNLRLRGSKRATLNDVECYVPSLDQNCKSVNHAYRLVSERFQPSRRSHTANVFLCTYAAFGNRWVRLEELRQQLEAHQEQELRTATGNRSRVPTSE